jgi:uncharacterized membrane protein
MKYNFTTTFLGLLAIIVIDMIYISINKNVYEPILDNKVDIDVIYAVLAWLTIIVTIQLIVLSRNDITYENSFITGAILGFGMYGVYNFTNAATYPNKWSKKIIFTDIIWGTFLTGSMSTLLYKLQDSMNY